MTCTLTDPHDCSNVRAANGALRSHLDRACTERDKLNAEVGATLNRLQVAHERIAWIGDLLEKATQGHAHDPHDAGDCAASRYLRAALDAARKPLP